MNSSKYIFINPIIWVSLFFILAVGCTRYYKPVPADTSNPQAAENVVASTMDSKYLILRQGKWSYAMTDVRLDHDSMLLKANLSRVKPTHVKYITAKPRHYGYSDSLVENEVHIYTIDTAALDKSVPYSLALDHIAKIEIIERDKGRTSGSMWLGAAITIGVIAGVVAAVVAAEAATAVSSLNSSCPYVSVFDGQQYTLQGDLFGGAVHRSLERQDYLPLNIQAVDGVYQLKISNELREKEYTNHAELLVIEHETGMKATIGTDGKPHLIFAPVTPASAVLNENSDVLKAVTRKDNLTCSFDDTMHAAQGANLILTYNPIPNQEYAKLVLNLKTSLWLEYLYTEFAGSFAGRYDQWQERTAQQKPEELYQWLEEQQIPLTVSVSTTNGWKEVTKLNTIGPLMNREVVIPIELEKGSAAPIRVMLSTGFLFWEVDYAALDFTKDAPVVTTTLKPYSAIDDKGKDVLSELVADDQLYLAQPETGNYAILKFKFEKVPAPGKSYSVVLSAGGYYEPIRHFEGGANWSFIRKFKKPGAMNTFSREQYQMIFVDQSLVSSKQH